MFIRYKDCRPVNLDHILTFKYLVCADTSYIEFCSDKHVLINWSFKTSDECLKVYNWILERHCTVI